MSLVEQQLVVTFNAGVDTRTDEKLVMPGVLTDSENGIFKKNGTISKRNGYESFRAEASRFNAPNASISAGNALGTYARQGSAPDELVMFSSGTLYTRAGGTWFERGQVSSVKLQTSTLVHDSNEQLRPSTDYCSNGVALTAYERGGVRAKVWSTETGAVLQDDVLIDASGTEPRAVAIGVFLFVFYRVGQTIRYKRLSAFDPLSFDLSATIVTDLRSVHPGWTVKRASNSLGQVGVILWTSQTGPRLGYVAPDGVLGSLATGLPEPVTLPEDIVEASLALAVEPSFQESYAVAYSTGSASSRDVKLLLYSSSLSRTITADMTIDSGFGELSGALRSISAAFANGSGSVRVAYTVKPDSSASSDAYVKVGGISSYRVGDGFFIQDSVNVVSGSVLARSVALVSDGFSHGTSSYFFLCHDSPQQPTCFLLRDDRRIVGRSLYGLAGGHVSASSGVSGTVLDAPKQLSPGRFAWSSSPRVAFESASGSLYGLRGVGHTEVTFDDAASCYSQAQLGQSLVLGGGVVSSYDGVSATEHGFLLAPESLSFSSGTGGSMSAGTYLYSAVYVWRDAGGQRCVSAPSVEATVVVGAGQTCVTASVPTIRLTEKTSPRSEATVELYRSQNGLPVLFRVGTATNDPTADRVSLVDVLSDAQIETNLPLYTEGVLASFAPPAASIVWVGKNRVFVAGIETNPYRVHYTIGRAEDEQPSFSPTLFFDVDPTYGKITAGATMDEKTVVFTERGIHVVFGDGPLDTGQQDTFSSAQTVNSDVGCVDQRSVALTPEGIVFKSAKGIRLLDRNLNVFPIGNPMQAYDSDAVVAATLVQDKDQVRFLLAGGKLLAYDYVRNQWLPWTNHRQAADATIWNGRYVWLKTTGECWAETEGKYLDAGNGISMMMETAHLRPPGLSQAEMRVRKLALLGEYRSPHFLSVEAAYDWSDTFYPATSWDVTASLSVGNYYGSGSYYGADDPYGGSGDIVYQVQRSPKRQRCQAIKLRIRDTGATGDAFTLSELRLSFGTEGKHAKLRKDKTV